MNKQNQEIVIEIPSNQDVAIEIPDNHEIFIGVPNNHETGIEMPNTQTAFENQVSQRNPNTKGVDIVWRNVNYTAHTKKYHREILKDLSGICKAGEMTAIMGSSGAGKTTLLNILCCRATNTKEVQLSGQIEANGQPFDAMTFSNFAAYVMQEDLIMETMTVREALQFAANLKLKMAQQQKDERVNEVIKTMRLEKCQNSFIGGATLKGITKGEKKRTSIAFELVSDPDVIFLDEPTSGLDSLTAYNVVDVLQHYAKLKNKTIICTIHQPSSEIFMKFDRLILLVEGKFIYQGPKERVIQYFASFGFQCPQLSNPADYFMSIMHGESQKNKNNYKTYYEHFDNELMPLINQEIEQHRTDLIVNKSAQAPYFSQLKILTTRSFLNQHRNPLLLRSRIIQSIVLGLFTGIVYSTLPDPATHATDQRAVNDFCGLLFFLCMVMHMNSTLPIVLTIPNERPVFLKEENSKLYAVSPYFFSKLIVESSMVILLPIIFTSICYYMTDLTKGFDNFCFFVLASILQSFVGNAHGMFCGSLFRDPMTAIDITPLMIMPFMLFGGFFKNQNDMPAWNRWITWLSNYRYTFEAYARNNFEGSAFKINPVEQLGLDVGKWNCIYILFGIFIILQICALLLIKFKKQSLQ
ncbi:ABC-2 family transporter protein (macronuclear) [Tetrahymena thermophila SB210]|uniref:ABC-2 family transporter protein n=1 Tax=Tetrahymena thermophila (strain SB210) TaxID=312017 RepID=Q22MI5_TETTS|nr:ABC-2 family transporter protein [Tetrahymena thermophila SB210]EAR86642.1 ABC-2 family transporter protein [Tetrahymena thermophila SB210]|eukprot:XP_977035.1 ABC-2 family transporter protein [Tetrahymena thermophila SB210]